MSTITMRKFIATVLSLMLCFMLNTAAMAAEPGNVELTVKILDAKVQKFDRAMQSRKGGYDQALVLRLEAPRKTWESLPPSIETFLYIGNHELRPIATELGADRVVLTFHDPEWEKLKGGEPMVLTTQHGDPIFNPEKYAGAPRFDPGVIGK